MVRALLIGALLAGCDGSTATATLEPTPEATPQPTATPEPTPSPTASPTPAPEVVVPEVVSFTQIGDTRSVRLHNPNESHGLIRSPFELALLGEDGAILAVEGSSGLPGAPCCTIYQLPPGGDYGLSVFRPPDSPAVGSVELTIPGDPWVDWSGVEPPTVTVEGASLQSDFSVHVTGRVSVDAAGPYNVWVIAFADTPGGQMIIADVVECALAGTARAFDISAFNIDPIEATLAEVVAYTTTVPGHESGFTPQC